MPFHSIVPTEAFLPQGEVEPTQCHACKYGFIEGRSDESGMFGVNRIMSTDPQAYLDPMFSPGSMIPLANFGSFDKNDLSR